MYTHVHTCVYIQIYTPISQSRKQRRDTNTAHKNMCTTPPISDTAAPRHWSHHAQMWPYTPLGCQAARSSYTKDNKKIQEKCEFCSHFIYSMHNTFPVIDLWKYICMKYIPAHMSVDSMYIVKHECAYYWVPTIRRLLKLYVSFAKEPYIRDDILQKRPMI